MFLDIVNCMCSYIKTNHLITVCSTCVLVCVCPCRCEVHAGGHKCLCICVCVCLCVHVVNVYICMCVFCVCVYVCVHCLCFHVCLSVLITSYSHIHLCVGWLQFTTSQYYLLAIQDDQTAQILAARGGQQ